MVGENVPQENLQKYQAQNLKDEAQQMINPIHKQNERMNEPPTNDENEADNEEDFQLGSNSEEDTYQNDHIDY